MEGESEAGKNCMEAEVFARKGEPGLAIAHLHEALKTSPENALIHYELAVLLEDSNRKESIKHYLASAKADPRESDVQYALGRLYGMEGEMENSIRCFTECIRLDPFDSRPYCGLGVAYNVRKDNTKSIECLQKAIELNPKDPVAYELLGDVKAEAGDKENALKNYKRSCELTSSERIKEKIRGLR
ncbi:MAG: tetratricopeptide repeat protein [Candidatus Altiarchaeota archaeon]